MKRTLKIVSEIECGEFICWPGTGSALCKHVERRRLGTSWHCRLFGGQELRDVSSGQTDHLQRLPECRAAEVKDLSST